MYFTCLEGSGRFNLSYFTCAGRLWEAQSVVFYMCWKVGGSISRILRVWKAPGSSICRVLRVRKAPGGSICRIPRVFGHFCFKMIEKACISFTFEACQGLPRLKPSNLLASSLILSFGRLEVTNVSRIVALGSSICRILRGLEALGDPTSNEPVGPGGSA